ncbi:MAG: LytTR family transcriptional regulator [Flavobacteriales bacterium]|jgi:hypothetical protein|nr:LytTR family transcriptional regulator [Flavobacteriales bacterium]
MLKEVLNKPYPRDWNISFLHIVKVNAAIFVFVTFFLYFFKPSSIIGVDVDFTLSQCAVYGFISFLVPLVLFFIIPIVSPSFCIEEKWSVKKELTLNVLILFSIAFFIIIYGLLVLGVEFQFGILFRVIWLTILIGIFPIFGIILYNQNRLLKKYIQSSEEINKKIDTKAIKVKLTPDTPRLITVIGEGKNETFSINPEHILYINSQSNYCEIVYTENRKAEKLLIRVSLANIFNQIKPSLDSLEKVHRSYLVNLTSVKNVSGNAQGYKLHFDATGTIVPVSRSLSKAIKSKIIQ